MESVSWIIIFHGIQKDHNVDLERLWAPDFGCMVYRCTISYTRFMYLACSFDDKSSRSGRLETDSLAPIREIWDLFIQNCMNNYIPSDFVIIDEQLLGFRRRFKGKVYIKNKPDKYVIKIISMNDAMMINAIPYTGRVVET